MSKKKKICIIPPFDHNNVLPPYVGSTPTSMASQSPYKCEILEFCQHFATSWDPVKILKGVCEIPHSMLQDVRAAGVPMD